ncbi:basic proline-rich protein-like [Hirundo rustica]|uniref:basic proline-rich protein-like n=1 Tax=Hirundo rustica TaxID=43150 RepID=UPI001A94031E|nr:basic proline-rich protein-like [Hirundo rustica]
MARSRWRPRGGSAARGHAPAPGHPHPTHPPRSRRSGPPPRLRDERTDPSGPERPRPARPPDAPGHRRAPYPFAQPGPLPDSPPCPAEPLSPRAAARRLFPSPLRPQPRRRFQPPFPGRPKRPLPQRRYRGAHGAAPEVRRIRTEPGSMREGMDVAAPEPTRPLPHRERGTPRGTEGTAHPGASQTPGEHRAVPGSPRCAVPAAAALPRSRRPGLHGNTPVPPSAMPASHRGTGKDRAAPLHTKGTD